MSKKNNKRIIKTWEVVRNKGKVKFLLRHLMLGIGLGALFGISKLHFLYTNESDFLKSAFSLKEILVFISSIIAGILVGFFYGSSEWNKKELEYFKALGNQERVDKLSRPNIFKKIINVMPFNLINILMAISFVIMGVSFLIYVKKAFLGYSNYFEYIYSYSRLLTMFFSLLCVVKTNQLKWSLVMVFTWFFPNIFLQSA